MKIRKDIILPPRLRSIDEEEEERHAEWLELLYDLVFVAAVSILALNLSLDYSFMGLLSPFPYFLLFGGDG
ncbi:MAG: hypothetical protein Q7U35_05215 [Methanobacteriaceae archaeon]|jgi:low temperature requirement protein LtrA|nr:hypothetical protein [Methanobacteriaceae archaeon]MDP2835623.1 hypothetical protein [Methanobacteriaceae archaeon]MDP3624664.1 hypothetical protein [Methanobacteriaceae archaeon]